MKWAAWLPMMVVGLIAGAPSWGSAGLLYQADLKELNGSGVTGTASFLLEGNALAVTVDASGLEAGQIHPQHIHGRLTPSGRAKGSLDPTPAADLAFGDGDGFIEVAEGARFYGPVILPLISDGDFPSADATGEVEFSETYDLSDPSVFAAGFTRTDLAPERLQLREIVLHGMSLPAGAGADGGEADGTGGYKVPLPVASGQIKRTPYPNPEPSSLALLGLGSLGLVPVLRRRRTRRDDRAAPRS